MANKIKYGLKNVYYAVATLASNGSATYATPVAIPGAVSLSMEPQGERSVFRADDVEYFTSIQNNGYDGDLEIAILPESFEKSILGNFEDGKKVLVEELDPTVTHFALLFEFKGDASKIKHVLYNCTAMRPTIEGETKGESIDPKTETLSLHAGSIYVPALDKDIVKGKTIDTTDSTVDSAWYTTVHVPVASTP